MLHAPKVRFAPSPTGYLHVGNVRAALYNWLFARKYNGHFLLRLDDTDRERSKPEFEIGIREDLTWLGLNWDSEEQQFKRMDRYELAKQTLIAAGRLYPCYDTPEELEIKRKMLASRGKPPIYDRAGLTLTDAEKKKLEAEGKKPHWRFRLEDKTVGWDDLIRGHVAFPAGHSSDPVLIREDGVPIYMLASAVDDGEMGITHIIRGEDHVSNTPAQIQLFEALGFSVPHFAHMALLSGKDGKLSKREGGGDIRSLRERGFLPLAINSYLAKIGTSDPIELAASMEALAASFDVAKIGRATAHYDEEELLRLNAKRIHGMGFEEVKKIMDERMIDEQISAPSSAHLSSDFWLAIRDNLHTLAEINDWWALTHQPVQPVVTDAAYLKQAAELLPSDWSETSWKAFTDAVKEATGRKGRDLFMPLRLALTAREDGPDLGKVFFLLGRERARKRLLGERA